MFSVMPAAWLMFRGRIPAALSSRNKDFVCARSEVAVSGHRVAIHHLQSPFSFLAASQDAWIIWPERETIVSRAGTERKLCHDERLLAAIKIIILAICVAVPIYDTFQSRRNERSIRGSFLRLPTAGHRLLRNGYGFSRVMNHR